MYLVAGNHFILGGGVKGQQIVGQFPERLDDESPINIRKGGRVIPTTSWESVWNAVATWFGVAPGKMDQVLPNRKNFPASQLLTKEQLFTAGG